MASQKKKIYLSIVIDKIFILNEPLWVLWTVTKNRLKSPFRTYTNRENRKGLKLQEFNMFVVGWYKDFTWEVTWVPFV